MMEPRLPHLFLRFFFFRGPGVLLFDFFFFFQGRPNFCSQLVSFSVRFFLSDSTLR